jgi:uncharacterized protein (DUF58 family)
LLFVFPFFPFILLLCFFAFCWFAFWFFLLFAFFLFFSSFKKVRISGGLADITLMVGYWNFMALLTI